MDYRNYILKASTLQSTKWISPTASALALIETLMTYRNQKINAIAFVIFAALGTVIAGMAHKYILNDKELTKLSNIRDLQQVSLYNFFTNICNTLTVVSFLSRRIFGSVCSSGFAGFQVGFTLTNSLMHYSFDKRNRRLLEDLRGLK